MLRPGKLYKIFYKDEFSGKIDYTDHFTGMFLKTFVAGGLQFEFEVFLIFNKLHNFPKWTFEFEEVQT